MAIAAQQAAVREQRTEFENAVAREQQAFVDGVQAYTDRFDDAVRFIRATYPGTEGEYQRFFADSSLTTGDDAFDPGIMLVETVSAENVNALRARERRSGNADFEIITLDGSREQHYVITRTAREVSLGPIDLIGLDVASELADELSQQVDGEQGIFEIPANNQLLAMVAAGGFEREASDFVLLIDEIQNERTNSRAGFAVLVFDPLELAQEVGGDAADSLNVAVEVLGRRGQVVDVDLESGIGFEQASLKRTIEFETNGLHWHLELWADDEFGTATGLFDQGLMWTFGALVTGALTILAIWRAVHERNLTRTTFELEHARTLAMTDRLTGLLNRQGFMELADRADPSLGGTLFFVDLDGFKVINDSHGHAAGDGVLREVAHRLGEQFRAIDYVCRYGGDEFVVFTPGVFGAETELHVSKRVIEALSAVQDGLTCSMGTAIRVPFDTTSIEDLISCADQAMYRAKVSGGGRYEVGLKGV